MIFYYLLRFAMEKFSLEPEDLSNTFIHLTNFAQVVVLLVMIVNSQINI